MCVCVRVCEDVYGHMTKLCEIDFILLHDSSGFQRVPSKTALRCQEYSTCGQGAGGAARTQQLCWTLTLFLGSVDQSWAA